uniref:Uncharacterized protein n=1 Tax=Oryza punctata TaxID=4537 RepID=A0A0E0K707_ORYPU
MQVLAQQNWAACIRNSQSRCWASRDRHPLQRWSALAVSGVQRRPVSPGDRRSPSSSASPTPTASVNRPPSTPPGRYPYLLVELMAAVSGEPDLEGAAAAALMDLLAGKGSDLLRRGACSCECAICCRSGTD